ncbi:MAG: hypothetical protein D4S01_07500 [Dehalococcoidia bacterium]|nr:MAG: hypothetical protein D4S01_07500 [Dehalococcoidia bacterium]
MQVKEILDEYSKYLQQTVNVSESTRYQCLLYVKHFLSEAFKDTFEDKLGNLKSNELIQYIMKQREYHNIPVIIFLLSALRSFLNGKICIYKPILPYPHPFTHLLLFPLAFL